MAATDAKYVINLRDTASAAAATQLKFLEGDGPLTIGSTHWMVKALPAHCPTSGATRETSMRVVQAVFGPAIFLDAPLAESHLFWTLKPLSVAKLLSKLDAAAALKWSEFPSVEAAAAHVLATAESRLSDAERTFGLADVIRHPDGVVTTGTYYDKLTGAMFLGLDRKDSGSLFDFKGLLPNCFAKDNLEEADGLFKDQVAHMQSACGTTSSVSRGQGSDLAMWHSKTAPSPGFFHYVRSDQVFNEVSLRKGSEAERFRKDFPFGCATVFPQFILLLPDSSVNRILELVDMMLKIDSSSSQATYETVLSLYEMIVQEKVVDVIGSDSKMVSAVDTVRASKAMKLIVQARSVDDASSTGTAGVRRAFNASAAFKEFLDALNALPASTTTHKDFLAFLLAHDHPAGKAWVSGVVVSHASFDALKGVRADEVLDALLTDTLSRDVYGLATDWITVTKGEHCLMGLIKGSDSLDIYNKMFKRVVARQKGKSFAESIGDLSMRQFWISEPAMRACKDMFVRLMAVVGFKGIKGRRLYADSFESFYSGIHKRLDAICAMPDWVEEKTPLLNALSKAASTAWEEHMEHVRGLHKEPLERMKRRTTFVLAGNNAVKLIEKLDTVMATVIERTEILELYGMNSLEVASPQVTTTRSVLSYAGGGQSRVPKVKAKLDDGWDWEKPKKKAPSAGSVNLEIGTYRCDSGIIFNGNILVTWADQATWSMAKVLKSCLARCAPNKWASGRSKYCTLDCERGDDAHEREFPDDEFRVIYLDKPEASQMPGWSEFADPANWTWVAGADTRTELKATFDRLAEKYKDVTRVVTWREDYEELPESDRRGGDKGGKNGKGGKGGKGDRRQRGGKGERSPNGKGTKSGKGGKGGKGKGKRNFEWAAVSPLNSAPNGRDGTDTWPRASLPSLAPHMAPLSTFKVTSGARAEKLLIEELGDNGTSPRYVSSPTLECVVSSLALLARICPPSPVSRTPFPLRGGGSGTRLGCTETT